MRVISLQRTYKELKQPEAFVLVTIQDGLQRTYKELKQDKRPYDVPANMEFVAYL